MGVLAAGLDPVSACIGVDFQIFRTRASSSTFGVIPPSLAKDGGVTMTGVPPDSLNYVVPAAVLLLETSSGEMR